MNYNSPPTRNHPGAPKFDGTNVRDLPRFFDDIDFVADEYGKDDAWKKKKVLYYAESEVSEVWTVLGDVHNPTKMWAEVKKAITDLYPLLSESQ